MNKAGVSLGFVVQGKVLPVLKAVDELIHHSAKKVTTPLICYDHEIMEIGVICSDLIENSHHSSNPGQNLVKCVIDLFVTDSEIKSV
jgi:hypothetical protein